MRILLTGRDGQLGFELERALAPLGEVVACDRKALDLADVEALPARVRALAPDLIVNAAAYTAVDRAEREPGLAHAINARAVAVLGAVAQERRARLVHFSTDYVFDGSAARPWREDDAPAPLGVYGASKLAGEQAVRDSGARHWIFRTSWVYAARGHNFLLTALRLARERPELRIVADQIGAPTPARWLATATALALATGDRAADGLYHLTAGGQTSWHGFASRIVAEGHARGLCPTVPVHAIGTADYPTPARRPAWSILDNDRFAATFGLRLPDWTLGLTQTLAELP